MIPSASLFLLLATSMMQTPTTAGAPGPGIPLSLAEERARRVSDLRYELHLGIPAAQDTAIAGRVTIRFRLTDAQRPLALDFRPGRIRSATIGGAPVALTPSPDHLTIPVEALREGENEITLTFDAGPEPLNRQTEFLYTLFVPARAHLAFPCFDQPDLKARWTLSLEMPAGWEAVSNGAARPGDADPATARDADRTDLGKPRDADRVDPNRSWDADRTDLVKPRDADRTDLAKSADEKRTRTIQFAETEPLPTYLFAFAAGRFSIETAERHGRTFRMFHRETDAAKIARNKEAVFDLHAAALAWLEKYTGILYPWGKFDFVLVPSFQFGGMEHAGSIFYNASALLLESSATQNQKLGRASLIAHETAHMWFGDLVTMRWFNDVWMKEVFANFMAAKIVNPSFPEIDHELRFLLAHYPGAYEIDRTPGTNAIRQRLDNLNEAGSLYGAIIYQKAPIVMRQLEAILGEAPFREGMQQYLRAHQFGNATWPDLIALLDERTPEDLAAWSRAWVEEAGRPILATELDVRNGRIARLTFVQRDPVPARGLAWNQRLQVAIGLPDNVIQTLSVSISGSRTDVPSAVGLATPRFILPSGGGVGYAGFDMDAPSLRYLLDHLPEIAEPLTRGAAWVTLWEQMLGGRASATAIVDLGLRALPRESDEQNVQRILTYLERAYWKHLRAEDRVAISPRMERAFRAGLSAGSSPSLKSAWFSALRDTARSRETIAWLERVWRKTDQVHGLTLEEQDYTTLALRLAVLEVPGWRAILDEQVNRIENPDRHERFLFVRPAVSADEAVRETFFQRLSQPSFRQRETWVLEGLTYLHHPLRAAASEKFIPQSLAMLQEIQRTGDIFFPKRWMDATLGGHSSATAAQMVKRFLMELPPDYPDRLRRVILSSSDELFRASGVER
jgi:aminopeptidase N